MSKKNAPPSPISTKSNNNNAPAKPKTTPQSNPTTPVTTPVSASSFGAALTNAQFSDNAIGLIVSVKTCCGETVQGEIYAYDQALNLLALCMLNYNIINTIDVSGGQHETSTRKSFKIINTNNITDVISITLPTLIEGKNTYKMNVPFPDLNAPLPALNTEKILEVTQKYNFFNSFLAC